MHNSTRRRFELAGWLLFVVSAGFFIWASWRAGDMVSLAGSLFFLLACFVFLAPLHGHRSSEPED